MKTYGKPVKGSDAGVKLRFPNGDELWLEEGVGIHIEETLIDRINRGEITMDQMLELMNL